MRLLCFNHSFNNFIMGRHWEIGMTEAISLKH
jgi:hypothetical protein